MKTRLFEDWIYYVMAVGIGAGSVLLVYLIITYKGV